MGDINAEILNNVLKMFIQMQKEFTRRFDKIDDTLEEFRTRFDKIDKTHEEFRARFDKNDKDHGEFMKRFDKNDEDHARFKSAVDTLSLLSKENDLDHDEYNEKLSIKKRAKFSRPQQFYTN